MTFTIERPLQSISLSTNFQLGPDCSMWKQKGHLLLAAAIYPRIGITPDNMHCLSVADVGREEFSLVEKLWHGLTKHA